MKSSLALAVALVLLTGVAVSGDAARRPVDRAAAQFLEHHWRRPISPQGAPPTRFAPIEASLAPASCGTCHPAQLADWKTSLHARAMGPGVRGQLVELARSDPETAGLCLTCHAPLAEQQPANRDIFDASLQRDGIVCAACHVREHRRFGPPRRDPAARPPAPAARLPHDGATRSTAFEQSAFCSSCHQFDADGFALNGTLLENTFAEWERSPAAARGLHCQSCHMPDRRHLWRGIHDPETVRAAVVVEVATDRPRYRPRDELQARITLTPAGVGHHFPTYVTPRVVVRAALVDAAGREVPGSGEERVIAREVSLDLTRELFDTRIPAGGRLVVDYRRRVPLAGLSLRVQVTVQPDHFYTRFFESLLATGAGRGTAEITKALEATRRSPFELYRRDLPLT